MQDFLVLHKGFGSFPSVFSRAGWHILMRMECLWMIKPVVVGFYVLLEVDATLDDGCGIVENTCTVSGSGMLPGLFQDFLDVYIKF